MAGNAAALRVRLASGKILTIPGCYDAMSAKLVEKAGFDAVYVSGCAVSVATQSARRKSVCRTRACSPISTSRINSGQHVALAGHEGMARTQAAAIQKTAILPFGM